MTTVVGARARARFDFWENFELVTGASRYRGDAAPVTPHGSRPPQHENKSRATAGLLLTPPRTSRRARRRGSSRPKIVVAATRDVRGARDLRGIVGRGRDWRAARPPSSSSQGSRGSSGRRDSGSDAGSSNGARGARGPRCTPASPPSSAAATRRRRRRRRLNIRRLRRLRAIKRRVGAAALGAASREGPRGASRAATAVHRAGAGLPSLGVSGSVAPRSPRLSVASYAETSAQRLKALQMLRERHARVVEESERAAESDKAARSSMGGGTLGGGGDDGVAKGEREGGHPGRVRRRPVRRERSPIGGARGEERGARSGGASTHAMRESSHRPVVRSI